MSRSEITDKRKQRDSAVETVAKANRNRVLAVINRTLRDRAEAEDVFQEVIEEYVESYDLGEVTESVSGWLMRVAKNKVLDRFRRQKVRTAHLESVREETHENDLLGFPQPDDELERTELQAQISEGLAALPPEQREVFVQHELEGKTFEEIAQASGVNISTLLSRKRYATQFLREYLKEVFDDYE